MPTRTSIIIAVLLLFAPIAAAATRPPESIDSHPQPGLTVLTQAPTFAAMLRLAQPTFVWNQREMLWITHDAAGKVGFAMNRVENLQIGHSPKAWYLFAADDLYCWDEPQDGLGVRYPHGIDPHPLVVARHPQFGVIYQACWRSSRLSGSGGYTDTRNILLLCDAQHHWHLLGEGPIGWEGCSGADDFTAQTVQTHVRWTGNARQPAQLTFTLCQTHHWDLQGQELDDPDHPQMTLRWELLPGRRPVAGGIVGEEEDNAPGPFIRVGLCYSLLEKPQSLRSWVLAFLHRDGVYDSQRPQQAAVTLASTEALIRQANPSLGDPLSPGAKILLPDAFGVAGGQEYSANGALIRDTSLGVADPAAQRPVVQEPLSQR